MNKKPAVLTFAAVSLACAASPLSFQTHYISLGTQDTSVAVLTDGASNVFVVSNLYLGGVRVTKTDPSGNVVAIKNFGQEANGAAVDPQGNLLVVGAGTSKLDNGLTRVLATSSVGGSAVATDPSGNVYVAGAGAQYSVLITELPPDLATVIHQTSFGSGGADCDPIYDACREPTGPGVPGGSQAAAIAIDPSGSVVVAGGSDVGGVPIASQPYSYGFVAKFSADLSSLLAKAIFDPGGNAGLDTSFQAMALDAQGNVLVVGSTNAFNQMPGATLQQSLLYGGAGIVLKYDNALQNLIWETYFGSLPTLGVAVDSQGNVWITGASAQYLLPNSTSSSIANMPYVAQITPDGTAILNLISSQFGGQAVAAAPNGAVATLGSTDSFLLTGPPDQPSLLMVANSANNQSSGTIAPIELISLFGTGIGPNSPLGGVVVDGVFTNSLGGYQVLFNRVPAPLLYAGPNQINVVAPSAIANQPTVEIQVVGPTGPRFSRPFSLPPRDPRFSRSSSSMRNRSTPRTSCWRRSQSLTTRTAR